MKKKNNNKILSCDNFFYHTNKTTARFGNRADWRKSGIESAMSGTIFYRIVFIFQAVVIYSELDFVLESG